MSKPAGRRIEYQLCIRTQDGVQRLKRRTLTDATDDLARYESRVPEGTAWVEAREVTDWRRV